MKFAIKGITLGMALALAVPATASADVVISTLANSPTGTDVNSENEAAQGFTTGSQAEIIQSVTLELIGGNGTATVSLLNDNGYLSPGSLAENIGVITPSGGSFAEYTLNAPAFTLAASTTYWLAVGYDHSVTGDAPGPWAFTDPGGTVTGSGTLGYFAGSFDGGSTWYTASAEVYGPYMLSVDASAVPEPSTFVVVAVAVLLGGVGVKIRTHLKGKADAAA